jgi:hypothetical protein
VLLIVGSTQHLSLDQVLGDGSQLRNIPVLPFENGASFRPSVTNTPATPMMRVTSCSRLMANASCGLV